MDPYQHIKAKYPGEVSALALLLPTLDALDTFRVANDLHWLLEEVERLRALEAKYEALRDQIAVDAL